MLAQKSQNKRRVLMFCNARSTTLTQPIKQLTLLVQNKQNESSEYNYGHCTESLPNKVTEAFYSVYLTVAQAQLHPPEQQLLHRYVKVKYGL